MVFLLKIYFNLARIHIAIPHNVTPKVFMLSNSHSSRLVIRSNIRPKHLIV